MTAQKRRIVRLAAVCVLIWSANGIAIADEESVELAASAGEFKGTKTLRVVNGADVGQITYYAIRGKAIAEGDILLGTLDEIALIELLQAAGTDFDKVEANDSVVTQNAELGAAGVSERLTREIAPRAVAIKAFYGGRARRWPQGLIPYVVDTATPGQQRITQAIAHWESMTPIRFVPRTAANASQYPNYVIFTGVAGRPSGDGCSSHVGMVGGRQEITIDAACSLGNVIHEIGHAVGLQHEQTRSDRDRYVQVVWSNIIPSMQGNFQINTKQNEDIVSYEYASLMHYPRRGFAIDPTKDTLIPLQPGIEIGQRSTLSKGDIDAVYRIYK